MSGTLRPWIVSLAAALLLACDPGVARPAEPAWGKQACAHCMMLLSDKRTAAQLTTAAGERLFFDDVGCLVSWLEDSHLEAKSAWVRSPDATTWIPAHSAHFAAGASTPMDFGFVPAASGISFVELSGQIHRRAHDRGGER